MKITSRLLILIIIGNFLTTSVRAHSLDVCLPTTISKEAHLYLQYNSIGIKDLPAYPLAKDITGWKKYFEEMEAYNIPIVDKLVAPYNTIIKKRKMAGVTIFDIQPIVLRDSNCIIIYLHGGAFTLFSAESTLIASVPLAYETGLRTISIDFSRSPSSKYNQIEPVQY